MAAASALVHGGAAALQAEEGREEPPEQSKAMAAPCPWPAAVAARYERREKLGQGMFGDVYRARDRVDGRVVAVKRLAGRTGGGFVQTGIVDFARQATSLVACRGHPSVVQLLATYAADAGDCVLVTEYAGPVNLREYMEIRRREELPFDEAEVREVTRTLLAGVKHAHDAGVLHRDVVPENVVVGQEGAAGARRMVYSICGFSMSQPAAARAAERDGSGMLASPSPYGAPELFLGSREYDGRVDTWGLGCIMAELLFGAGEPFFVGCERDDDVYEKMLRMVGARGIIKWPGMERVPAESDRAARARRMCRREGGRGYLREVFPETVLSPAGFKVLEGLLQSNPERRLTAAKALRMPWFRRRRGFGGCFRPCGGDTSP